MKTIKEFIQYKREKQFSLFIKNNNEPILKHEHIITYFDDFTLRYHDTRKFGRMYLVDKNKLYTDTPLSHIGKEPCDLTVDYLKDKLN